MRQIKDCKEGTNIAHVIHIPPHLKKKTSHNFFPRQRDNHKNAQECRFKKQNDQKEARFRLGKFNQQSR